MTGKTFSLKMWAKYFKTNLRQIGYFENVMNGNFNLDSNPIILDNQDINNDFISSPKVRNGYFIELDIMKYNLLEKIYHQNLSDFHIGFN